MVGLDNLRKGFARHKLRKGFLKKLQPAPFREDVTQTRERFDPEAEAIQKDDVTFYECLISTAILHVCASHLYKEARS